MWKKRAVRTFYVFCFHFNVPLIFNKIMLKTMTHMSNYLIIDQGFHKSHYLKIQCLSFLIVTLILCSDIGVLRRCWLSCLAPMHFHIVMKMYKDKKSKMSRIFFFVNVWRKNIFDIYVTEYGTALTTILPILSLYLNTVTVTAGTFEP